MGRMSSSSSSLLLACTIHYYLCYIEILSPSCLFFMKKKTPVALFKECWQLFKESNRGLHSLRPTEQRPRWKQNWQISLNSDSYQMCHLILGWIKVSYSSWLDSKTRKIKDSRTAAIICNKVGNYEGGKMVSYGRPLVCPALVGEKAKLVEATVSDCERFAWYAICNACFTSLLVCTYYMY